MNILREPDAEAIKALQEAASPRFPSLQQLAFRNLSARDAWQELAREVGRADLADRDDRAAHEHVIVRVLQDRTHRSEALARAAGLEHLLYSHALQQRAEHYVRPETAAWRELTTQLGLPEYRLSDADPNARHAVATASLRLGTQTIDELVQKAGLSQLRDQAVEQQRADFLKRKQRAGPQRGHEGHSF